MAEKVKIKSFPNGITLELNQDAEFDEVLSEIAAKFSSGKNFFGNVSVALSIKGREVTDQEENCIIEAITANSDVNIICIVEHDDETEKTFIKALQQVEKQFSPEDDCSLYRGTLKDNDVNPGCVVSVTGSIIVIGGLYGEAHAGRDGMEGVYVIALEMEPEKLKIGDFKYRSKDKRSKWGIRPKIQPKIAYEKDGRVVLDNITKELLADLA